MTMKGRRLQDPPVNTLPHDVEEFLEPGDYIWLVTYQMWVFKTPNGILASLNPNIHKIVKHPDRTVTVTPSILVTQYGGWHGYLTEGVWITC